MPSDTQAHDGKGKSIFIKAHYLGAVKQVPPMLEALLDVLPKATYRIRLEDYTGKLDANRIFNADTEYLKPRVRTLIDLVNKDFDTDVSINFPTSGGVVDIQHIPKVYVNVPVEPLKFEKRHLLTPEEQDRLRARYRVQDRKVILGGSLGTNEIPYFCAGVRAAHARDSSVVGVIVPRCKIGRSDLKGLKRIGERVIPDTMRWRFPWTVKRRTTATRLITTCGNLPDLYAMCDIAVIGATLWNGGPGQNPLEPAFYGKRIVSGKNPTCNTSAFNGLAQSGLLSYVGNQEELNQELSRTASPDELAEAQERAAAFIASKQGFAREAAVKIRDALYGLRN